MNNLENQDKTIKIFILILSLILLSILFYSVQSILNPIIIYILLIFLFYSHREFRLIKISFSISSILFFIWAFDELKGVLLPFIISFLIAYLLQPVINFFERLKIKRWIGSIISVLATGLFLLLIMIKFIPNFFNQINSLIISSKNLIQNLNDFYLFKLKPQLENTGILYPNIEEFLKNEFPTKLNSILNGILFSITSIILNVGKLLTQFIYLLIIPILTFLFSKDFQKISNYIINLFNEDKRKKVIDLFDRLDNIVGNYIKGAFFIALINLFVITISMLILNVKYAFVIGLISSLFSIIPTFGVIISISIALIISLLSGNIGLKIILIPIIFLTENFLETYIYMPKIVGTKLNLHPLIILFSLFVFGYFGGIIGMLISIPITAFIISYINDSKLKVESKNKLKI